MKLAHIKGVSTLWAYAETLNVENLYKAIVIVPSYKLVKKLSENILKNSGNKALLLPRFFTLEDLYEHVQLRLGVKLYDATVMEKKIILSSVLKEHDVSLSMLDEYFISIEICKENKLYPPNFLKIRDSYLNKLTNKNISLPIAFDAPKFKWLIGNIPENIFVIPTLENFSTLSEVTAPNLTILHLPQLPLNGILPDMEALVKNYCNNTYDALQAVTEVVECKNKFELIYETVCSIDELEESCIIVESDEIKSLLSKEFGLCGETLIKTHIFKLFYSIAALAFDPENLNYLIEIATNPVSIFYSPQHNCWLRDSYDLRPAHKIVISALANIDNAKSKHLERFLKQPAYSDFSQYLQLHSSIFFDLLSKPSCEAHQLFEMQQFLRDLDVYLSENHCRFSSDYLDFLISIARAKTIELSSSEHVNIFNLKQYDYQNFKNIIIVENGLAQLEKRTQEDGQDAFAQLCIRFLWLCNAQKIKVLRVQNTDEESIFYTLFKPHARKVISKNRSVGKKCAITQPEAILSKELRPKQYSVTDITKLLSDPYCYYAEHILKLRPKECIWEDVENRDFGILVHNIISKLNPEDADYNRLIEGELTSYELTDSTKALWRQKLEVAIEFVKSYYAENNVKQHFNEYKGFANLICSDDEVVITARADRIDEDLEGRFTIIDFKTGYTPSQSEVDSGEAPQLAIESWIMSKAGFDRVIPKHPSSARYIAISGRSSAQGVKDIKIDDSVTENSLVELFTRFYNASESYFATPNTSTNNLKFIHLKRLEEWF
jgi:RecB family exonuclease